MTLPPIFRTPWIRRLLWAVASLLAVWAVAWGVVPPLLKAQLEARGSAVLGRQLTVGAIDFKPWTLELTLTDIAVATQDGSGKQLGIARVYLDAELESLLRLAPVLDAITVEAPTLHITHLGQGRYDVDDILARLSAPADQPPSAPLRFALYNLTLSDGAVDYQDQSAKAPQQHSLRKLHLALPFLSNLDASRDVKVTPRLAFELNGSAFDTAAEATPFAPTRKGDATLKITHLDLAPYLPYLPASLPVQLKAAVVDADVQLGFVQTPKVAVTLSGTVTVSDLKLADATGAELLAVGSIQTVLADVRPLEQTVKLASIDVTAPKLRATRNRAGRINLDLTASRGNAIATKNIAARADVAGATAKKGTENVPPATPWTLALERFTLHQGEVAWADDSTATPTRLALSELELQATGVRWPLVAEAATFEGSAAVAAQAKSAGKAARLAFKGEGTDQAGTVHATVGDLALGLAAPYVAQQIEPVVNGVLDAELDATWQGTALQLAVQRLAVRDFAMQAAKFKLLEIADAHIDLAKQSGRVGRVSLRAPNVAVQRDEDGHWMFEHWLKTTAAPAPSGAPLAAKPTPPWKLVLAELAVDEGTVALNDRSLAKPVRLEASALKVQMKNLSLDGKTPAPLTLFTRVRAGRTEPGTLSYKGTVMWDPVAVQGNLEAVDLPAHAVAPYVADQLNIELLRADASFKGEVRYSATPAGPQVQVRGDVALEEFRSNSASAAQGGQTDLNVGEELLSWKSLNIPGLDLNLAPGMPTRLQVREAVLSDFYARLLVNPQGRLNLQDLVKTRAAAAEPAATAAASPTPAPTPSPEAVVRVGPIRLIHGKVLFSDRFIQPNYSADLSDLNGQLSQFSSQSADGSVQLADLEIRGRAEGTASLEIVGKVNPLAKPLALDIKGKVRDLELPPLSAYAIKYAGYGIERGKLSVDVNYTVKPDGQLTAANNIVLNQLVFGNKVEGAPNSLPVKLAVALLADRHGVIDLNLPISGSLNDPQFSLGAVVWKVITNLVVKAVTSPFNLLASAFGGGGDELSAVAFAPGSSVLAGDALQGLDKVAKALADRPALSMTVVGTASLEAERDALKQARLNALMLAEKRRRAVVSGQDAAAMATFSDAEAPALLKEVYKRADITKPRNLVGLSKDIAPADMQALLLASIQISEDTIRDLALQRGVAVKDYLATRQVPAERLFLGAAKAVKPDADWKPRAELSLTSQ